jgi:hypothetical protein
MRAVHIRRAACSRRLPRPKTTRNSSLSAQDDLDVRFFSISRPVFEFRRDIFTMTLHRMSAQLVVFDSGAGVA